MIRLSILTGAATVAGLWALSAAAQPAAPNDQAQGQNTQARQPQYQGQRTGKVSDKDAAADPQRQLWLQGLAPYEAKYGRGSYDEYAHAHPDVTTTVAPAGKVEQRSKATASETPAR
jgi:hypothetical protein